MNLWAKSLRQLSFAAVALFFFSCEDENAILGFKNPVPKFNVSYVEIPLTSNAQLIDSIITDNKAGAAGNMLIGRYTDPIFGTIQAQAYLQILPSAAATVIPRDAIFDSLTISVRYSFYGYGFTGERTEKFAIHELLAPLDRTASTRYRFNTSGPGYNPSPMAEAKVKVLSDSLTKQYNTASAKQDTLVARARLSDAFGRAIFKYAQDYKFSDPPANSNGPSRETQVNDFLTGVHGLALIPTESDAILGFRIFNNLTAVTIHYRTLENGAVKDTLSRTYGFNEPSYTKITVDRSGSPFANAQPYQSLSEPASTGLRYLQNGNPVITKLSLKNFYAFADTVNDVLINEASLVIDGVESPLATPALSSLTLKVMNENNQFANTSLVETDRAAMQPYVTKGVLVSDGSKHYLVRSDLQATTAQVAAFNYTNGKYFGYLTLFLQQLIKQRHNSDRITALGLFPLSPGIATSVSRTVFNAENVKLKIYYTKPTLTKSPN